MLDGNSAALRNETQRQYYVDSVFARHEAAARGELEREAAEKIKADAVEIGDVWDELLEEGRESALTAALSHDLDFEIARVFRGVRDELLAKRRTKYVEDRLETRVWELENGHGE